MATLNMYGPYELTTEKVDEVVTRESPGNYGLGYTQNNTFYVCYVGRCKSQYHSVQKMENNNVQKIELRIRNV